MCIFYKIKTMRNFFDEPFDCNGKCLVLMQDGTKLPLYDFKSMSYVESLKRGG